MSGILSSVQKIREKMLFKEISINSLLLLVSISCCLLAMSCVEGSSGGPVGGVVIDSPRKPMEALITGRVMCDAKGLAGVKVEIKGHDANSITDEKGYFRLNFKTMTKLGVNRRRVQIQASLPGYRTRTTGVYVEINQESKVIIQLLPVH